MPVARTEVKVYLSEDERLALDTQAAALMTTRGQLIRDRALGRVAPPPANKSLYLAAVNKAARTVSGVPRPQLEAIVAAVITTLSKADAA